MQAQISFGVLIFNSKEKEVLLDSRTEKKKKKRLALLCIYALAHNINPKLNHK